MTSNSVVTYSELIAIFATKRWSMIFMAAVGSVELTERILADNPARIYEF
jgi:hypothetical protein